MKGCPYCDFALYERGDELVCMGCDRSFTSGTGRKSVGDSE